MKVYIGPYKNWVGPYQIADLLAYVGVSEDRRHKIGEWLSDTPLLSLCQWIESKRKRRIKIRIDKYDTWNMDATLAGIVLPMLKQLHKEKHGAPNVDDNDVPEHLQSKFGIKKDEYDVDSLHFKRWDWVMEEMIWAFEQLQPDVDWTSQFYSGVADYVTEEVDAPDSPYGPKLYRMVEGPNHTQTFDAEGFKKHDERIAQGLRLFGKYYRSLWD